MKHAEDAALNEDALPQKATQNEAKATMTTAVEPKDKASPDHKLALESYHAEVRDLANRLTALNLQSKPDANTLPKRFTDVLGIRIRLLKALDVCLRPLTAGTKIAAPLAAPAEVENGLWLADEIFIQMTKIIQPLIPKPGNPPPPAPVLDDLDAAGLWHSYANGKVLVFRDIRTAAAGAGSLTSKAKAAVEKLPDLAAPGITDLLTRVAILLNFAPTCQVLADVASVTQAKQWLIVVFSDQATLAKLPGDAQTEAIPNWKASGWHTGLMIGQEKDSSMLLPAGKLVVSNGSEALVPDKDGKLPFNGYTLAPREIILAHELNHMQRQLRGGWMPDWTSVFPGGIPAEVMTEVRSAFQTSEEYKAAAEGEQPLRALIGLQPRGHASISKQFAFSTKKPANLADAIKRLQ
jgi:hypothetical protein